MSADQATICKGCWEQLHLPVPLRGLWSAPFRVVGIRPSRMNPDTCTVCELMFSRVMRARKITIDATVLFADLRGYTRISETLPPDAVSDLLDGFYDDCGRAIWRHEGILNKALGDAVMAVFNFPLQRPAHAANAVQSARAMQAAWRARVEALAADLGPAIAELGMGIGIDSGALSFGEFGRTHRDLTAIGSVVNRAARAQAAATAGEILATAAVYERVPDAFAAGGPRAYKLKGFDAPVPLYAAA